MGFTSVEIYIHNPEKPTQYRQVTLLVDTGTMYTFVPAKILEGLGIQSLSRRKFTLANGLQIDPVTKQLKPTELLLL